MNYNPMSITSQRDEHYLVGLIMIEWYRCTRKIKKKLLIKRILMGGMQVKWWGQFEYPVKEASLSIMWLYFVCSIN
jgi:hypothetical protein